MESRRRAGRGGGADGGEGLRAAGGIAAVDEHGRAEPGEPHGRLEADAARGAGDQHGLAVHAAPGGAQPVQRRAMLRRHAHDGPPPSAWPCRPYGTLGAGAVRRPRARSYSITNARPRVRATSRGEAARATEGASAARRHPAGETSSGGEPAAGRTVTLLWLRRDLRLGDNPALLEAAAPGRRAPGRPAPARVRVGAAGAPRLGARRRGALVALALAAQPGRRAARAGLAAARSSAATRWTSSSRWRGPRAPARVVWAEGLDPDELADDAALETALRSAGVDAVVTPPGEPARRPAGGAQAGRRSVHRVHAVLARPPRGRRAGRAGAGAGEAAAGACRAARRAARRPARRGGPPLGERVLRAVAAGRARRARAAGGVPRRAARRLRRRPRPPRPRRQQPPLPLPALGRGHGAAGLARRRRRARGGRDRPGGLRRAAELGRGAGAGAAQVRRRLSPPAGLARVRPPPAGGVPAHRGRSRCTSASRRSRGATTRPRSRPGGAAAPGSPSSTRGCARCGATGWMHNRVRHAGGVVPRQGPAAPLAGGRGVVLGDAGRRRPGQQHAGLAVGGRLRRGRGAVLPRLQPGDAGPAVRPRRGLRAPLGAGAGGPAGGAGAGPVGRGARWISRARA